MRTPLLFRSCAFVGLIASLSSGCGGGGNGGGGGASTTAPVTSAPASTTGSGSTTTPAPAVAAVTSLRLPAGPVLAGDVAVAIQLAHPQSTPTDLELEFSADGGATWKPLTTKAPSPSRQGMATSAAPGVDHAFTWATTTDVPTMSAVLVRATPAGGAAVVEGPITVDNLPMSTVRLNREPYVQLTTQTTSLIVWRTDADTDSVVQWGETPALGQVAGDPGARTKLHEVELRGLRPGTRYYYRVLSAGLPVTPRESFGSAPDANHGDFRFVAFGDSGTGSAEQVTLSRLISAEQADFAIHTGDIIYPFGALGNPVGEYNDKFFKPYAGLCKRMPIFPVIGNHDLIAILGQPYKEAFYLPDNGNNLTKELYFAFEWGDAKFIALETTGLFLVPLGQHAQWLDQQISQNTKKWLIVYMHVPLYSSGNHGDNRILQAVLGPIFENGKVDLVITGHDHHYERTTPIKDHNRSAAYPGLVHIVTGGGGAGTYGVNPRSKTAFSARAHHYMRFHAHGDDLDGEAVDLQGQVIDRFTIKNQ